MKEVQEVQAMAVRAAAKAAKPVWAGDDRVTLRDAYEACRAQGTDDGCSFAEFGALCMELSRAGLLQVTRWDLTSDYARRDATEILDRGSAYHFVVAA